MVGCAAPANPIGCRALLGRLRRARLGSRFGCNGLRASRGERVLGRLESADLLLQFGEAFFDALGERGHGHRAEVSDRSGRVVALRATTAMVAIGIARHRTAGRRTKAIAPGLAESSSRLALCATSTDAASPRETVAFIGVLAAVMQAGSVAFRDDSTDGDRPTPNEPAIAFTR